MKFYIDEEDVPQFAAAGATPEPTPMGLWMIEIATLEDLVSVCREVGGLLGIDAQPIIVGEDLQPGLTILGD